MKTKRTKGKIPKYTIQVKALVRSTFENHLGNLLAEAMNDGWELMAPPTFTHRGEPDGINGYAVGFKWPHFLVLLCKKPKPSVKLGKNAVQS